MAAEHSIGTSESFTFAHAEGWLLYLFIAAAVLAAWWAWRRYGPAPAGLPGRIARICRVIGLVLLIALLAGPGWRRTITTTEPGTITVLTDLSSSMALKDAIKDAPRHAAVKHLHEAWSEAGTHSRRITYRRIGGRVDILKSPTGELTADGNRSALGEDIEQIAYAELPDLMILVSDGRITDGSSFHAISRRLTSRQVPRQGVWVLGVGSEQVEPELNIDRIIIARELPMGERQPVQVKLSHRALTPDKEVQVVLKDAKGTVYETYTFTPKEGDDELTLQSKDVNLTKLLLDEEGEHRLTLEATQGDLKSSATVAVSVRERRLKVLILAHRPRYELRYLKEALRRDPTVTVHTYLADGRWRPWGVVPEGLKLLPLARPELLKEYDAIIMGDIGADRFKDVELNNIYKAVNDSGAGLIWLPGESGATASFKNKKLGDLLPVDLPNAASIAEGYLGTEAAFTVKRTKAAEFNQLLAADGTQWDLLPPLYGRCRINKEMIKRGNRVLMETGDGDPIVVDGVYGAGRVLFVGIDDTWRWRRDVGDKHLHEFYSQLLRHVSSHHTAGHIKWRIVPSPRRTVPGALVKLGIIPAGPPPDSNGLPDHTRVQLSSGDGTKRVVQLDRPIGEASFLGTVPAPPAGTWLIEALDLTEPADTGELVVLPPSNEIRDPRIDRAGLTDLAEDTGGRAFFITQTDQDPVAVAKELVNALPSVAKQRSRTEHRTIWDSWWSLLIICLIFSIEWAIRRWHRLP